MHNDDNTTKPFDNQLFVENDETGRTIVKKYLGSLGYDVTDHTNKYGVDLDIWKNNVKVGYGEVEVRHNWKSVTFPFPDLNIPFRKKKLFEKDLPVSFFSINESNSAMFFCGANVILNSQVVEVKNKYVPDGELFFKVNISDLNLVIL